MVVNIEFGAVYALFTSMLFVIQVGLFFSGLGYVSHGIVSWLAELRGTKKPDPTIWKRAWQQFFYTYFQPYGEKVTSPSKPDVMNWTFYQLTIGFFVTFAALGAYFILAGGVLAGMVVSYYSVGTVPDLSSWIETIAALCTLFALATIFYAPKEYERAVYS